MKKWRGGWVVVLSVLVMSANAGQVPVVSSPANNLSHWTQLNPDAPRPIIGGQVSGNVPTYEWWYGCSPTSGGMIVGYWDSKPGYGKLFDGDASMETVETRAMVASNAHITAGSENSYTYGDWHNSASYPNHEANPDCIADFMKTVDGGSYSADITSGLEAYVEWNNPSTAINESYPATAQNIDDPYFGGSFTYDVLKLEIEADRPVLLNVVTYCEWIVDPDWYGHSIVAYGYQDDMFTIFPPGGSSNVIVPGIAVKDTWTTGTTYQSEWIWDSDSDGVADAYYESFIDPATDIEWWPFYTASDAGGTSYNYYWDWMLTDAVTLDVIPEPATVALLGLGALAVLKRRKR